MGAFMNTVKSIGSGDILLRMRVDKLFPYILYTFLLGVLSIWLSYRAEITMQKVEENKKKIENLGIENLNKTCDITSLTRASTIETMLNNSHSEVKRPEKPAYRIK